MPEDVPVMERWLAALQLQTGSDYCAVARFDAASRRLRWTAASGHRSGRYRFMASRPGEGLAGEAFRFGTLVRRAYAPNERKRADDYTMLTEELLHAMAAPIPGGQQPRGVLFIGRRTVAPYGDHDVELLAQAAGEINLTEEARS